MSDGVTPIIESLIDAHGGAIISAGLRGDLPNDVLDSASDLVAALRDQVAIGRQIEADRGELNAKRDLLPGAGFDRLWREAHEDARDKTVAAETAAERTYARLEAALQRSLLPEFSPGREQFARDEAALALSSGDPEYAVRNLALYGGDEPIGALFSPWGQTLLRAHGIENADTILKEARAIVVRRKSASDSPAAEAIRHHLGPLAAAKGSASNLARSFTGNR